MDELTDMRELNGCTMASTEGSRWKEATQRYIANMLLHNLDLRTALLNGTYRESPTIRFTINERGHIRDINAPAHTVIPQRLWSPSCLPLQSWLR